MPKGTRSINKTNCQQHDRKAKYPQQLKESAMTPIIKKRFRHRGAGTFSPLMPRSSDEQNHRQANTQSNVRISTRK